MRITGAQLLLAFLLAGAALAKGTAQEMLQKKVSVSFRGIPLDKAIDMLGEQAEIDITYNSAVLPKRQRVKASYHNQTVDSILSDLLSPHRITYVIVESQIILRKNPEIPPASLETSALPEEAADIRISGIVRDENGEGLPGVSILIKGSQRGTTTDGTGKFEIEVPDENAVLTVSFVGYLMEEVAVGNRSVLDINMKVDEKNLEEVVVVGYGTVNRRDLTGSVASVSGKELKDIPVTSAAQAIAGRLPGVQVTKTEGSPDADIKIRIRGGGSITQDNSPLFLVDGFPVSNINDIAPTDILTIDVLKDASSTAIYGARGANGVVIITTKGGQEGKGKVSYNMFYGQKQITKYYDVLDPYEYAFWQYEIFSDRNTTYPLRFGDFKDMHLYKEMTGTNWQQELFGHVGSSLSNNLSVSGGNKVTKYSIGLTRNDEKEVMLGSGFGRTNLTIRTNNQINKWLSLDLNTRFSDVRLRGAGTSANSRLAHIVQFRPVEGFNDFVDADMTEDEFEIVSAITINPLKQTLDDYRRQSQQTVNLNGAFNIKLPANITYRLEFGKQYSFRTNNRFYGIHTTNAITTGTQPLASIEKREEESYRIANVLTYAKNNFLPGSNLNVVAGQELNHDKSKNIFSSVRYLPKYIDAVSALNMMQLGMAEPITTADNAAVKLSSFFGRVNYDFKGKYLFSSTMRVDGSSQFAPGNQWGYFPSAAVAWRILDEAFMKSASNYLDDLKLRFSLGAAGNNRISSNAWRKTLSVKTGLLFIEGTESTPTPFLAPNNILANPLLKWETTLTRNLGLDFAMFKRRITGTVEVYKNTTSDLLISATIPSSSGYTNQFQNIGQTSNRGLEVSFNAVLIEKRDFSLAASFNIGFNKNRIEKLGETKRWEQSSGWSGPDGPTGDYLIEEGGRVGLMYGYETHPDKMYSFDDFIYENENYTIRDDVASNRELLNARWFRPGTLKFVDQNGDGIVEATQDKVVIGDANPKHTGGINLTTQCKNFDLSAFFNWVYGNDIYNANKLNYSNYWGNRLYKNLLGEMTSENRFTSISKETGLVVNDPVELAEMNKNATYWAASMTKAPLHSWVIEDGSFLRLNTLTLGYSLPQNLLSKFKISQLRVYASGFNLWIWTRYTGYDPEVDSIRSTALTPGVDFNAYPRSRSYNVGLNLTF